MNHDIVTADNNDSYRYTPSVMSKLSFLPQTKPKSQAFKKTNGRSAITVASIDNQWAYGAVPRMFLIHVRSLIKNGSPLVDGEKRVVYLDDTYRSLCKSMGISYSNANRQHVLKMIENLGHTTIFLEHWETPHFKIIKSFPILHEAGIDYGEKNKRSYVEFSPEMWSLLTENCVPLNPSIVKRLSNDALALDVYQWLAFRANGTRRETRVSWEAVKAQFKYDGYPMREFRRKFRKALEKIQKAWPELKVETTETGVTVQPSVPSIRTADDRTDAESIGGDDSTNPFAF